MLKWFVICTLVGWVQCAPRAVDAAFEPGAVQSVNLGGIVGVRERDTVTRGPDRTVRWLPSGSDCARYTDGGEDVQWSWIAGPGGVRPDPDAAAECEAQAIRRLSGGFDINAEVGDVSCRHSWGGFGAQTRCICTGTMRFPADGDRDEISSGKLIRVGSRVSRLPSDTAGYCRGTVPGVEMVVPGEGTGIWELNIFHFVLAFIVVCLLFASGAAQLFFDWIARAIPGLRAAEKSDLEAAFEEELARRRAKALKEEASDLVDEFERLEQERSYDANLAAYAEAEAARVVEAVDQPGAVPQGSDQAAESAGDRDDEIERLDREGGDHEEAEYDSEREVNQVWAAVEADRIQKRIEYGEDTTASSDSGAWEKELESEEKADRLGEKIVREDSKTERAA